MAGNSKKDNEVSQTGLYWPQKRTQVDKVILPFQTVETVNESKADREKLALFRQKGEPAPGWRNKLIWGDNKYIMASLLPDFAGKINLIYIDPPFATGADFSINITIGDLEWTKEPSVIEEKAYRDTWGKGLDSYLQMMYDRLVLMRELLADDGSIYVHCDWRLNSAIRFLLDEVFGSMQYRNEITWKRDAAGVGAKKTAHQWGRNADSILWYSRSDEQWAFTPQFRELDQKQKAIYSLTDADGRKYKTVTLGDYSEASIRRMESEGLIHVSSTGKKYKKRGVDG